MTRRTALLTTSFGTCACAGAVLLIVSHSAKDHEEVRVHSAFPTVSPHLVRTAEGTWLYWVEIPVRVPEHLYPGDVSYMLLHRCRARFDPFRLSQPEYIGRLTKGDGTFGVVRKDAEEVVAYSHLTTGADGVACIHARLPERTDRLVEGMPYGQLLSDSSAVWPRVGGQPYPCVSRGAVRQVSVACSPVAKDITVAACLVDCRWEANGDHKTARATTWIRRSQDGGGSWGEPELVGAGVSPSATYLRDGRLAVVAVRCSDDHRQTFDSLPSAEARRELALDYALQVARHPGRMWLRVRDGEGGWKTARSLPDDLLAFEADVTTDDSGRLWVAFTGPPQYGPGRELRVVTSSDEGASWTAPRQIEDSREDIYQPDLLVDERGVSFAYTHVAGRRVQVCARHLPGLGAGDPPP